MSFHENDVFRDTITAASAHFGIREVLVEKDYWVTFILKNLSQSIYKEKVVFKGGISLSKAYNIIKRFSEGIDLAVLTDSTTPLSSNQLKTLIIKIEKALVLSPLVEKKDSAYVSKGLKFRKTAHSYPRAVTGDFGYASDKVILEINSFTKPYPFHEMKISSYISQFMETKDSSLVLKYGLEPFTVNVLSLERTLVEKILALVRASYQSDGNLSKLREKIRHIYDVHLLLKDSSLREFIKDKNKFSQMIKAAQTDDQENIEFQGSWSIKPLAKAVVFEGAKKVINRLEDTFKQELSSLLFAAEDMPLLDEVADDFSTIHGLLLEYDKK